MAKIKQTFAISFNNKEHYLVVGDPDSDTTEIVLEALYREVRKYARILTYKVYVNNVRYQTFFVIPRGHLNVQEIHNLNMISKRTLTDYEFALEPILEKDAVSISEMISKSNVFELVNQDGIEYYLVKSEIKSSVAV